MSARKICANPWNRLFGYSGLFERLFRLEHGCYFAANALNYDGFQENDADFRFEDKR
jgi:hypothetical protein